MPPRTGSDPVDRRTEGGNARIYMPVVHGIFEVLRFVGEGLCLMEVIHPPMGTVYPLVPPQICTDIAAVLAEQPSAVVLMWSAETESVRPALIPNTIQMKTHIPDLSDMISPPGN